MAVVALATTVAAVDTRTRSHVCRRCRHCIDCCAPAFAYVFCVRCTAAAAELPPPTVAAMDVAAIVGTCQRYGDTAGNLGRRPPPTLEPGGSKASLRGTCPIWRSV